MCHVNSNQRALVHLSALKTMRVVQAGADGAVEEGELRVTPAAESVLSGQHAANAAGLVQHGQVYTPLLLPFCLMLLVADIMGLISWGLFILCWYVM